jgi:hypothetical protein
MDGMMNGPETDYDCGGGCPWKCPPFQGCLVGSDCLGGLCSAVTHTCSPSCTDGFQDGSETDVDCGGACAQKCGILLHCFANVDCVSAHCCAVGDVGCQPGHCAP